MNKIKLLTHKTLLGCLVIIFHVTACAQNGNGHDDIVPEAGMIPYSDPELAGVIKGTAIEEASGLIASRVHEHACWTHNDSGGEPKVYLVNTSGEVISTVYVSGAENRDWEDIAIGTGPEPDVNYIYVAEIGDNDAKYKEKKIYRFPEPSAVAPQGKVDTVSNVEVIRFVYPDGNRDAETLLIDPLTKDIYVISKREPSVFVYRAAYPQDTENLITLEKLGSLPFVAVHIGDQFVGGDISTDGKEVLLKTYNNIYYWKRDDTATGIYELLQSPAIKLPYDPEPQGEAITFSLWEPGFYTLSEKRNAPTQRLFFYKRK